MGVTSKTVIFASALLQLALPLGSAAAGPLYDWVYGTPSGYTANYRGYGNTGGYTAYYFPRGFSNDIPGAAASDPTYYQPGVPAAVVQPPAAYQPPPVAYVQPQAAVPAPIMAPPPSYATPGCNSCQGQTYNYRPPAYRTTTMRVPVTVYRPVTAFDPVSGTPVTSYQACTTYRVQPRRVAGWDFPILSWLFGHRRPVYTQPVVANYGACGMNPCGAAPYVDGGYAPAAGAMNAAPSAWQPAGAAPAQQYVPSAAPPAYSPQGMPPTGGAYQPQPAPMNGSGVPPAETQPRLRPDYDLTDPNNGDDSEEDETDLNNANGTSFYRAPVGRPHYPRPAATATTKPEAAESPRLRLQMVPDPDAPAAQPDDLEAPQLIDPRDRTARSFSRQRSWGVVPASWPIAAEREAAAITNLPAAEEHEWDDSGWRPARRSW